MLQISFSDELFLNDNAKCVFQAAAEDRSRHKEK